MRFLLSKFSIQHFVASEYCDFTITHIVRQLWFWQTFYQDVLVHGECLNLDGFWCDEINDFVENWAQIKPNKLCSTCFIRKIIACHYLCGSSRTIFNENGCPLQASSWRQSIKQSFSLIFFLTQSDVDRFAVVSLCKICTQWSIYTFARLTNKDFAINNPLNLILYPLGDSYILSMAKSFPLLEANGF